MSQVSVAAKGCTIVIFGASGDLTSRKLIPALLANFHKGQLPEPLHIVGFARRPYDDESFRALLLEGVKQFAADDYKQYKAADWKNFAEHITYFQGDLSDPQAFHKLATYLKKLEQGDVNRLYYLATSPEYYQSSVQYMGQAGLAKEDSTWRRLVIEKPFGEDLASAQALNQTLYDVFNEQQIYRIDHYLGKETAQNILFFRFANGLFEPVWNKEHIHSIQISVTETVDVGHRAGYYDQSGVLRDMFQNHLLQLLTLVTMETPDSFEADELRDKKVELLSAIRPLTPDTIRTETVRGQYEGYCQTEKVDPHSKTATYAALRLFIDNRRWQGVPIYLRSGKALADKRSEIVIRFKPASAGMFNNGGPALPCNNLAFCIQPDEGIHLDFQAKEPGSGRDMRTVSMQFHYRETFGAEPLPDAYQRLILDAINGDPLLFVRGDEIEAQWKVITPILQGWDTKVAPPLLPYAMGTWGPSAADELLTRDGNAWLYCCHDE